VVADTQQLGKTETKELTVTLVRHGRIAELIINGASTGQRKLNPMPPIMYPEMFERLQEFDADRNLNVLVMHGAGEEAFTVGGDLRAVGPSLNNYQDVIERYWNPNTEPLSPWVIRLGLYSIDIKKPVIAAVKGYCLGVGLMIIGQHADLVVCSEDSTFGLTEIKRGLGGGTGARANLGRYIPFRLAMKLVLTGGSVGAGRGRADRFGERSCAERPGFRPCLGAGRGDRRHAATANPLREGIPEEESGPALLAVGRVRRRDVHPQPGVSGCKRGCERISREAYAELSGAVSYG